MDIERRKSRGRLGKSHLEDDEKFESMNSLIAWNISKILEAKPDIDLKAEIESMQELLETRSWNVSTVVSHCPEDRHLACALLAWQQLGHGDASSLYQFIQSKLKTTGENETGSRVTQNIYVVSTSDVSCKSKIYIEHSESIYSDSSVFNDFDSGYNFGPRETKVVMRCEHGSQPQQPTIKCEKKTQHCCTADKNKHHSSPMMSTCQQRLVEMDSTTAALKKRVEKLAKHESDRMKLILRAEAAWKNLEQGYINRLTSSEEKEEEIIKQIRNTITERSGYKQECLELAKILEERLAVADKDREELKKIEGTNCEKVRKKLRLAEEVATGEASLAQEQCRLAQYDRELRSKEDQTRRRFGNLQIEVESLRALKYEAERSLRAELGSLKDQLAKVSKRLLTEESDTNRIKNELEQVRETKMHLIDDLDACKVMCDNRMQGKIKEFKTKTEKLDMIKEQVLDCQCKQPKDNSVEAKRTPSLAAICRCSSDDKLHRSCSCKSVRTTLLSKLLKDLFEGLQSELNDSGSIMPCELLKCLEDSHNWDHSSAVKTNLRHFFEKLLVGELDVAIASSIEKYHAQWIGESCADRKKSEPDQRQQRALEYRAQELAEQLAEQLFEERAEQVMQRAKNMIKQATPICDCSPTHSAATYSCILNTQIEKPQKSTKNKNKSIPILKEKSAKNTPNQKIFKKTTLKPIKERTNKLTTPVAVRERKGRIANHILNHRAVCTDMYEIDSNFLMNRLKNKCAQHSTYIDTLKDGSNHNVFTDHSAKVFKTLDQSYAVNLCLFEPQKDKDLGTTLPSKMETNNSRVEEQTQQGGFESSRFLEDMPSVELANSVLQPCVICNEGSRVGNIFTCSKDCVCFNRLSSNHTLDNILQTFRENNMSYSSSLNEKASYIFVTNQDRFRTPHDYDKFCKFCEAESKQKYMPPSREITNRINVNKSAFSKNNVDGFDSKRMDCKVTQASLKTNLSYNDGKIKKSCDDPKHFQPDHDDFGKHKGQNVIPTLGDQCNKYTNIERNLCDTITSAQSFNVQHDSASLNMFKKCIVDTSKDPFNLDCRVDFLGVTLHNSKNKENKYKDEITNKPSKEENFGGKVQSYCNDKNENEFLKIVGSKLDRRNNETQPVSDSFKQIHGENTLDLNAKNKCVCCNKNEETCELEVNTFSLLMEYLQKKLEEYKLSTCRSSDISSVEADLLFNQILEKVKKMILESSKELACLCISSNECDGVDACWRRACGLLQEYLRAKIKRLDGACFEIEDFGGKSFSEALDKICKMIENDFDRLKAMSKDTSSLKYNKAFSYEKQRSDTTFNDYIFNMQYYNADSNVCSKKNSLKDTPSAIVINDRLNIKISEDKDETKIEPNVEASKCYSVYSNKLENDTKLRNSAGNELDNHCINKKVDDQKTFRSTLADESGNVNVGHRNIQSISVPCVSHNVDCACNKILSQCTCSKTILKENVNLIDADTSPSYIMQNITDLSKPLALPYNLQQENEKLCEKEIETLSNTETVQLKGVEGDVQKCANNSTNTRQNLFDNVDYFSYDEWDDCESVPYHDNASDSASNKVKLYNNLLLPLDNPESNMDMKHINKTLLLNSDEMAICSFRSHDCDCEMVPICHVKMLMDNIERKLLNYKCTCDSLHPSVCPAHSDTVP